MRRITISIEQALLDDLDAFMARSGAGNRSEAIREILRRGFGAEASPDAECVGVLSYTLDPAMRDLGRRIPQSRQERHDATVAALSAPLDHDASVEVTVMRGPVEEVNAYAESLFLERGVRHGRVALIPVRSEEAVHEHGGARRPHRHIHVLDRFEEA
ncbi:nickel-responsive transcriptional regulator NikR [Rubrimonas cliftonensis]|uniref:CopG family transcriptional regulator, nickel-responsive regulator n=1 Tax=Rubrimonas cliftonensis TaxID=89524 RepID=A0A1H4G7B7_9RHOB|nr:nickel-responsive transcriptional regulator NikR [Rubrimonas cliftonensis]SEB05495.1 CopG family transcriptional regulator, nickel-responsive regulator [Rubrimonas cliftonensis]